MDIVEKLRDAGDHARFEPSLHHKAADEIEWLREALRFGEVINDSLIKNLRDLAWQKFENTDLSVADKAADEIERLRKLNGKIIESFRVNMMRLCQEYSHEEFDKLIASLQQKDIK